MNRSVVFFYPRSGASCSQGDVVCYNSTSTVLVTATTAALATASGMALGVALEDSTSGDSAQIQVAGVVPASISGLGAGAAGYVKINSSGRMARASSIADTPIVGECNLLGDVRLLFGIVTGTTPAAGSIVDSMVSATAAIQGTKLSPNFGAQNVVTTGTLGAGNTTVNGLMAATTITSSGASTLNSLGVTGNATVGGALAVTGAITAAGLSGTTLTASGNSTIGGTLGVTGATSITGATTLASTLGVTAAVTASSTLSLGGAGSFGSGTGGLLFVTNATLAPSAVPVGGALVYANGGILNALSTGSLGNDELHALNSGTVATHQMAGRKRRVCTTTTDATPTDTTFFNIGVNGAYLAHIKVIGRLATPTGSVACYYITAAFEVQAGTVTAVGTPDILVFEAGITGANCTVTTPTTLGNFKVTLTGVAATTIRWQIYSDIEAC